MHNEQKEIIRHAVVGGFIAVSLAVFHDIADNLAQDWFAGKATALRIAEWVVLFGVVFASILAVEAYLRRRQWRAKIQLVDVGVVDGRWVDVVVKRGNIISAGILEISSAVGEGFTVRGISHYVGGDGLDRGVAGRFWSLQGTSFGKNGIAYVFEGTTGEKREHFGVAYMQFTAGTDTRDLRFEGAFLARQETDTMHTMGVKLNEGIAGSLSNREVFSILEDFLRQTEVQAFVANRNAY